MAIDPGSSESAYVILNSDFSIKDFGKVPNTELLSTIEIACTVDKVKVVIEMIASYGMAVGATVFDTCVWIGRFTQVAYAYGQVEYIYRKEEKINLCHTMKAKDTNIRQALIDRFGIVGTKKHQGYFYGFKSDIWSSFAVAITFMDKENI